MKNSKFYARKIRKLLVPVPGKGGDDQPVDPLALLVRAVFEENATPAQADKAVAALAEEFIDFNELRVSPPKDLAECVGRDYPNARAKARSVTGALNRLFDHANTLQLDYLADKPKREVRKILREDMGLSLYAESVLTLCAFGGHAIPVDNLLLEALKLDGCIHPDSDEPDLQGFLERIIHSRDAKAAHGALRAYATKSAGAVARVLARREKLARAAQAKAEAEARKAEAAAQAQAEARARAKSKAEAAKAAAAALAKKAKKAKKAKAARRIARAGAGKKRAGRGAGGGAARPASRRPK